LIGIYVLISEDLSPHRHQTESLSHSSPSATNDLVTLAS